MTFQYIVGRFITDTTTTPAAIYFVAVAGFNDPGEAESFRARNTTDAQPYITMIYGGSGA